MQNKSTLLKVVSILMIIFGALAGIIALIALFGSFATMAIGVGFLTIFPSLLLVASAALELVTGIVGLQAANGNGNLKTAKTFAIITLVLAAISLLSSLFGGTFGWSTLTGAVLPILYFVGVRQLEA